MARSAYWKHHEVRSGLEPHRDSRCVMLWRMTNATESLMAIIERAHGVVSNESPRNWSRLIYSRTRSAISELLVWYYASNSVVGNRPSGARRRIMLN